MIYLTTQRLTAYILTIFVTEMDFFISKMIITLLQTNVIFKEIVTFIQAEYFDQYQLIFYKNNQTTKCATH